MIAFLSSSAMDERQYSRVQEGQYGESLSKFAIGT